MLGDCTGRISRSKRNSRSLKQTNGWLRNRKVMFKTLIKIFAIRMCAILNGIPKLQRYEIRKRYSDYNTRLIMFQSFEKNRNRLHQQRAALMNGNTRSIQRMITRKCPKLLYKMEFVTYWFKHSRWCRFMLAQCSSGENAILCRIHGILEWKKTVGNREPWPQEPR